MPEKLRRRSFNIFSQLPDTEVEVVLEIQADIPSGAPENDPSPSTHLRLEGLPQRPAWSKNNSTERELM
ncbi:MAG: hypothetical protein L0387_06905 [Acidobacteria bacterium]|nr:hypothetical protein [Acidobacteriota bacterium]